MEQDRDDRAARARRQAATALQREHAPTDAPDERVVALDGTTADAVDDGPPGAGGGLSERDRAVLAFERQWWKVPGSKERAIREHFDLSATRYYQLLNALVDTDEAVRHDPMLVKRLRRARAERVRGRTARRLGLGRPD